MPITHDCAAVWDQGRLRETIETINFLCRHLVPEPTINFWELNAGSLTISTFSEEAVFCWTSSGSNLQTLLRPLCTSLSSVCWRISSITGALLVICLLADRACVLRLQLLSRSLACTESQVAIPHRLTVGYSLSKHKCA